MRLKDLLILSEIERYPAQTFDKKNIEPLLKYSSKIPFKIENYQLYTLYHNDVINLILFDDINNNICAFIAFLDRKDVLPNLWQAKNAQIYYPYNKKGLVGKMYKCAFEECNWNILSDVEQSPDAEKLWTKTLPNLGLNPKIIDLKTNIIYQNDNNINVYDENEKYCWILI